MADKCADVSLVPPHHPASGNGEMGRTKPGIGRKRTLACLRSLVLVVVIVAYVIVGAFIFNAIESPVADRRIQENIEYEEKLERELLQRIWTITGEMNILFEDAWFNRTRHQLSDFSETLKMHSRFQGWDRHPKRWTLPVSGLYSFATITTIGGCQMAPRTLLGNVITVMYTIIGAPLMFFFLVSTGRRMADGIRHLVWRCQCCCRKTNSVDSPSAAAWLFLKVILPVSFLLLFGLYVMTGGILLSYVGYYSLVDSMYMVFSALSTQGIIPGINTIPIEFSLSGCVLVVSFLVIGMLLISVIAHFIFEPARSLKSSQN